jgi:tetratricopeptide (TPR) repeat protein
MKCNNLAEALAAIADKHGGGILLSPRLPSYLSDYLPKGKGEYNFLMNAFELDIPVKLRDAAAKPPEERQITLARCVSQMTQEYFIAKEMAEGYLRDFAEALGWEKMPDAQEQFQAGEQYYKNNDYPRALACYQKAAEQGHADAQYMLGNCYYEGKGAEKDYKRAFEWYKKSAEQGNAKAQNSTGFCYDEGNGTGQDYKLAFEWYTKSAAQGNVKAWNNLGVCYCQGNGIKQDY